MSQASGVRAPGRDGGVPTSGVIGGVGVAGGIWGNVNRKHIVRDAVKDLAEISARKLAEAPEPIRLVR